MVSVSLNYLILGILTCRFIAYYYSYLLLMSNGFEKLFLGMREEASKRSL